MLAVLLTALVATVNAHTWTYERGALAAGHDLQKKNTTVTEVSCSPLSRIAGSCVDAPPPPPPPPAAAFPEVRRYESARNVSLNVLWWYNIKLEGAGEGGKRVGPPPAHALT